MTIQTIQTNQTNPKKAKRRLSDIDFTQDSAHIALVSKEQGHGANGHHYALVMKSNGFSQEAIQKMQSIQVTLELPEFLRRFFDMFYTDSEVLARLMGYVPEEVEDDDVYGSEDYYAEKLQSFTVMKSLQESGDILKALAMLDENQYLNLLQDQVEIEKALAKAEAEKKESDSAATVVESENSTNASVEKSVGASGSKVKSKKENMTTKTEKATETVEMVEKSALESIQKSLEEKSVELQKALDALQAYEAEKKEAVVKAKSAQITSVVKDESIRAAIVKAALALDTEEDFNSFVQAINKMAKTVEESKQAVEKSALFVEQGVATSEEVNSQEDPLVRILKAQVNKAK